MKTLLKHSLLTFVFMAVLGISNAMGIQSNIPMDVASREATKVAEQTPGWFALQGSGNSMSPHYEYGDVLLAKKVSLNRIQPGMIVVYLDSEGDLVGHKVIAKTPEGIRVRGANNIEEDPELVSATNFKGVVVGILHSNGQGSSQLPVVIGKRY